MARCSHPVEFRKYLRDITSGGKKYKVYLCLLCDVEFWVPEPETRH